MNTHDSHSVSSPIVRIVSHTHAISDAMPITLNMASTVGVENWNTINPSTQPSELRKNKSRPNLGCVKATPISTPINATISVW